MDDLAAVRAEYLALRDGTDGALLATLDEARTPAASYAPLVWVAGRSYLFLSDLAAHTQNLRRNAALSLLLIEESTGSGNAFARRRITLRGEAQIVAREDSLFAPVLAEFRQRFGEVVTLLEALPDFHLFALNLNAGRYIRGFGQAFELSGEQLDQLAHIHPGK